MAKHRAWREARFSRLFVAVWVLISSSSCQRDTVRSTVCLGCTPVVGGETTSFDRPQGVLSPCYAIDRGSVVNADEAEAQGFGISDVRPRIEREFATSLHWHAQSSDLGAPATGYEANTHAHVRTSVIGYYLLTPDTSKCEPTSTSQCMFEGATCVAELRIGVRVHIETDDGALVATLNGTALILTDPNSTFNRELGIDATADVTSLAGSLRLRPSLSPPFVGTLLANFSADGSQGSLSFVVAPQPLADPDAGFTYQPPLGTNISYQPLDGLWGRAEELFGATPTITPQAP